jgi:hypothetical protein
VLGRRAPFDALRQVGRDAVLDKVSEVEPEPLDGVGVLRTKGERLLELVEDEEGGEGLVLGAPPLDVAAVQVLPQTLALARRGGVDAVLADFGLQRGEGLLDERRRAIAYVGAGYRSAGCSAVGAAGTARPATARSCPGLTCRTRQ